MPKLCSKEGKEKLFAFNITSKKVLRDFFSWGSFIGILCQMCVVINYSQTTYFAPVTNQTSNNLKSSVFRQEIARFEITVVRDGKGPLSITQVPRVQKGDILKIKLSDEAVNGIKPEQSFYDWTLLVAFVNPNRKITDVNSSSDINQKSVVNGQQSEINKQKEIVDNQNSVSQEIQFRKTGWYRVYSFTVPYDSQPIFFFYPPPKYRDKILKLINKNYNEVRKLGEKTIEIAGAYAQISSFLNNLQMLLGSNPYGSGGNYGGYNSNNYNSNGYNNYGTYNPNLNNNQFGYNYNQLMSQTVEMLARSFNIQLPSNCWQSGYSPYSNNSYGTNNNFGNYGISQDLLSRVQCIANNLRLEDFDFSVAKLLQQGGVVVAAQLAQKYPQLTYWINLAAVAIDLIVKITKKTPLKIVPTVTSSSDNLSSKSYSNYNLYGNSGSYNLENYSPGNYQNNYNQPNYSNNYTNNSVNSGSSYSPNLNNQPQSIPKISVYAENQPDDNQFVTAYPIILHKWQADADPDVISLRPPVLMEPCLHTGVNILRSTDLTEDQLSDNFTKDYTLIMSSTNGFKKEFPLKKNIGFGGWEFNITPQDMLEFPKIQMNLESVIKGTRGFNEIMSPPFYLPISIGGSWQITPDSQQNFTIGGKRTITLRNTLGNCRCLQTVIYKPSFGGQFVFDTKDKEGGLNYSHDGKDVSFEVDASNFQAGDGKIELRTFGGEKAEIPLKLYPLPPVITGIKIGKGDREAIISGERLEQINSVKVNSKRAFVIGNTLNSKQTQIIGSNSNQETNKNNNFNDGSDSNSYITNLQTNSPNERIIVFDDTNAKITENTVTLELALEGNRIIQVRQTFPVNPSRPTIATNENGEVEGIAIDSLQLAENKLFSISNQDSKIKSQRLRVRVPKPLDLSKYPVIPIGASGISLKLQNVLTDYDFKAENISIETKIEGSEVNLDNPLESTFEVLDWKNIRLNIFLNEQAKKSLGGRRLQFRIRDKIRGYSDWFTIKQTFVRVPTNLSIKCSSEMNNQCELKGEGIDYIAQISFDGGQTWFPQLPETLQAQPTKDGLKAAMIPLLIRKTNLRIRLRDFTKTDDLIITNVVYSNLVKNSIVK